MKIQKKKIGGGSVCRGGGGGGGQGGCERRIEVFVKIQKIKYFFWGGRGASSWLGGGGEGVSVDVNGEVKFL